ncbi:MAG TPA: hypothetical protein VFF07_12590 [Actinomycetota bacterium]|nr:hypothetical protein [Actinomycetota bacterium]
MLIEDHSIIAGNELRQIAGIVIPQSANAAVDLHEHKAVRPDLEEISADRQVRFALL